jgi:hypothetical protein
VTSGVLLLLCVGAWIQQSWQDFAADDAFISYRYATHWANGLGPVFNAGERVEGYTNFLLTAILALAARTGADVHAVSRTLGTLCSFALLWVVFHLATARFKRPAWVGLAAAICLAVHAGVAVFARSGLETVPLTLAVAAAQATFLWEIQARRSHWRSALVFAVAALLRADGFLWFVATALFCLIRRTPAKRLASLVGPFVLVVVPWFVWRWSYYGDLLPNTWYLRTGGDIHQQLRGLFYLYKFIGAFGGWLLFGLPLLLWILRDPHRDAMRLYLGVGVALQTIYVVWLGGDHMPMGRFLIPAVPALTILVLEAIVEIVESVRRSHALAPQAATATAVLLCGLAAFSGLAPVLVPRREPQSHVVETRLQTEHWTRAGHWFRAHLPPGTLLATDVTGAVAYYSQLPIVDMLGVNDRHIAHRRVEGMGRGTAAHEKSDFDYVLSRQPAVIFRGVWESTCETGATKRYADGSTYIERCVALGPGHMTNRRGETRPAHLYLWYEERQGS